ncbi:MAG: hypothetical protein CL940_12665 [Deltaproteobacteria bacterium]|nr:hypothetical protein [Deltaproteobacteria bacterium]
MKSYVGPLAQAGGDAWTAPVPRASEAALVGGGSWAAIWSLVAVGVLLIALIAWLIQRSRGEAPALSVRAQLRADLLVPIGIQTTLLTYWGLYYGPMAEHAVMIIASLAFAIGLDLLLRVLTRDEAVLHLATIPLVLSIHLFVWFEEQHEGLIFVIVAIALLSKVFIQRAGRHIFNPSALGIALIGVTCYLAPDALRYVDIAHALNTPPNMFEAILLLGLIAQLRAPIVLVSVSAAVVQYLAIAVTGGEALIPSVHWAPVTLAIVLLATDPATIPRTGLGRILFGALYAALMIGLSLLLESNGISDFFTKVIPIPICNALAPVFDRLHGDVDANRWSWLSPQHNRAHIGVWLFVMLAPWFFIGGKANLFEGRFHPLYGTPHIRAQGPVARCEDNPAFCVPFSFPSEAMLWIDGAPPPVVEEKP